MITKIETFKENFNFNIEKIQPKDWEELFDLINNLIEMYGNDCDLNFIDTSLITNMSWLFSYKSTCKFNGDISQWNTSNVTNMEAMFYVSEFNGDISKWDVGSVTNMDMMFENSQFNGDIGQWNVNKVTTMNEMFYNSELEKKNKLPKWYKKI